MVRSAPHRRRGVFLGGVALVDLHSLMGSRNVVETRWGNEGMERGEERRVESPLEGVDGEGEGREGEGGTALVVDTALEGRGWRKCGTSNSPGLPTPAFPTPSSSSSPLSKRGARARALSIHPSQTAPLARFHSTGNDVGRRGRGGGGYRYTTITDTLTDDFVLLTYDCISLA